MKPFAPRFKRLPIPEGGKGKLIGTGGVNVKRIMASSGATLMVDPDVNEVLVYAPSDSAMTTAVDMVTGTFVAPPPLLLGADVVVTVKELLTFGAVVTVSASS
jgi:polyribonucleotide nucleotidyltransferase